MSKIRSLHACRAAILPSQSLVVHAVNCWSNAKWDSEPSKYASQLWHLQSTTGLNGLSPSPYTVQHLLGCWKSRRYDFYHCVDPVSQQLLHYRAGQQDAILYTGQGLFAGSDGSVNYKQEHMGTGYAVTSGLDLTPIQRFSAPVGGPLASSRAEAVGLLYFLHWLLDHPGSARVTVFIDSLGLLQILSQWGRADFWPGPKDIIHFDVLLPLLQTLRKCSVELVLIKVKSHAGCYHNEMADECAGIGCASDDPPLCPGPHKYGTLHLRLRHSLRDLVEKEKCSVTLPQDWAPNKVILRQAVKVNTERAMRLRGTIFVRSLLQQPNGAIVARVITKSRDAEVRCWMQCMTGTYPVASYLHLIGKVTSKLCQHCQLGSTETLSHFLSVCPRFHDARTAAHNQIRECLSSSLRRHLPSGWILYEETALSHTGLRLRPVPSVRVEATGRPVCNADLEAGQMYLGRWRPDLLVVSFRARKIAVLEVCRPSDVSPERLQAAYFEKLNIYSPLIEALGYYIDSGWTIKILPWVVGARGLVQERVMYNALEFLEIARGSWISIIECSVSASISALAFMHRIRFSSSVASSTSKSCKEDYFEHKAKYKKCNTQDGLHQIMARWKRITSTPRHQSSGDVDHTTHKRQVVIQDV